jgi:two-component system sensor histidine kinase KdpD
MKKTGSPSFRKLIANSLLAGLTVAATTVPLALIGRDTLGEAVIALLYLLPVAWSAYQWGQLPGISAALTAALAFDFLFIPPFYTFTVARLESWLVLAIFLGIAAFVVGRIQASNSRAREATFMYELSAVLSGVRTQDAAAHTLARQIQQLFQASLVRVIYQPRDSASSIIVSLPEDARRGDSPDRVLPVLNSWGLIGEIQIWRGLFGELPPGDGALFLNFAVQAARAFERTQTMETEKPTKSGFTPGN